MKEPFVFEAAYARAAWARVGSASLPNASIDDLIAMKRVAGRPRDQEDITALLALRRTNDE